jgi:hypothetical protein
LGFERRHSFRYYRLASAGLGHLPFEVFSQLLVFGPMKISIILEVQTTDYAGHS